MDSLIKQRIKINFTQQEMANKLGVSHSYYSKLENGNKTPSYNFLVKVKKEFPELDMNIFLDNNNTKSVNN